MMNDLFSPRPHITPPRSEAERVDWLRLIRSHRVGATTFHRLMEEHGTAAAALDALPGIARAAGVKDYCPCTPDGARREIEAARRAGAQMLCHGSPAYPAALLDLPDAPPLLWAIGDAGLLARPAVAMVGARNASSLGLRMAKALADNLATAGVVVVSGLARGIDAAAHQAALAGGTVAVQAGGVDVIYPAENAALAEAVAAQGLRLSEQPMGLEPQARHFPIRNRIVAGLSLGVIVVEAAARSGSLITARIALDQGREVLAVPGHPFDARAAGCNMLIRDGAVLVRGSADVLEALADRLAAHSAEHAAEEAAARRALPSPDRTALPHPGTRGSAIPGAPVRPAAPGADGHPAAAPTGPEPGRGRGGPHRPSLSERATPAAPRALAETAALHSLILNRLGPSPLAEDQLIRDLALPAAHLAPALLALELEGRVLRQPGGLLSRGD